MILDQVKPTVLLYILTSPDYLNYFPDLTSAFGSTTTKNPNLIKYKTHLIIMTLSLTEACVRCHFTASGTMCPSLLASLLNYSFQSLCCKVPLSSLGNIMSATQCTVWDEMHLVTCWVTINTKSAVKKKKKKKKLCSFSYNVQARIICCSLRS